MSEGANMRLLRKAHKNVITEFATVGDWPVAVDFEKNKCQCDHCSVAVFTQDSCQPILWFTGSRKPDDVRRKRIVSKLVSVLAEIEP